MGIKTSTTAVVIVPPDGLWEPIQAIRRAHDPQIRRWMPHITMLYPFRPREDFDSIAGLISRASEGIEPFEIRLAEFRFFEHGARSATLWLRPEPEEPLVALQETLWRVVPDCDDVRQFASGFTPHLSVGKAAGRGSAQALQQTLQASWQPLSFRVSQVSLIARNEPPDDVFRVVTAISLGGA